MAKKTDKKSKVKKAKKAKKAELSRKREEMLRSRALEEVRGERLFSEFLESRKPAEVEASKVVETEASKVVEAETSRIIETETSKAEKKEISRPVEPIAIKPGKEKFASAEMLDLETNSHHTPGLVDREVDREAEAILSLYAASHFQAFSRCTIVVLRVSTLFVRFATRRWFKGIVCAF